MLRANGESTFEIAQLLVLESFMIGLFGCIAGLSLMALSMLVFSGGIIMPPTPGTNRALPVGLLLTWQSSAFVIAVCLSATLASTMATIRQISRISIVNSLRSAA